MKKSEARMMLSRWCLVLRLSEKTNVDAWEKVYEILDQCPFLIDQVEVSVANARYPRAKEVAGALLEYLKTGKKVFELDTPRPSYDEVFSDEGEPLATIRRSREEAEEVLLRVYDFVRQPRGVGSEEFEAAFEVLEEYPDLADLMIARFDQASSDWERLMAATILLKVEHYQPAYEFMAGRRDGQWFVDEYIPRKRGGPKRDYSRTEGLPGESLPSGVGRVRLSRKYFVDAKSHGTTFVRLGDGTRIRGVKTLFPETFSENDIAEAVKEAVAHARPGKGRAIIHGVGKGLRLTVRIDDGVVVTAYPDWEQ
jgi:hypothetical protein